jgi:hypothetical protein
MNDEIDVLGDIEREMLHILERLLAEDAQIQPGR